MNVACFVQSCLTDADFVLFSNYCLIGTRQTAAFFLQQRGACVPIRHGGGHVPPPVDGVGAVGHPHRGRVVCGAADSGETRRPRQADEDKSPLPRFRPEHRDYGHGNGMRLGSAFPGSAGISETVDFLDSPSGSTGRGHGDSGAFQRLLRAAGRHGRFRPVLHLFGDTGLRWPVRHHADRVRHGGTFLKTVLLGEAAANAFFSRPCRADSIRHLASLRGAVRRGAGDKASKKG